MEGAAAAKILTRWLLSRGINISRRYLLVRTHRGDWRHVSAVHSVVVRRWRSGWPAKPGSPRAEDRRAEHGRPVVRAARALWAAARASCNGDSRRPHRCHAARQEGACGGGAIRLATRGGRDAGQRQDGWTVAVAGGGRAGGAGSNTVITNLSTTSTRGVHVPRAGPRRSVHISFSTARVDSGTNGATTCQQKICDVDKRRHLHR